MGTTAGATTERAPSALTAALAAALAAPGAAAQANYQSYPVGGTASGMGGAYTALADDSSGAYYNPAGPAFAVGDSLSLSTNLYGMVGGSSLGAFGRGVDFDYRSVNIVPSAASSLSHLGASTRERPSRWVFTFNVFAPQTLQVSQRSILNRGETTLFTTYDEKALLVGPTLSLRLSDRLAVGLSLYGSYHALATRTDLTDVFGAVMSTASDFIQLTLNNDASNLGLVAAAGARWEPTPGLLLGLSVRSPTVHVYGSGSAFQRVAVAATSAGRAPAVMTTVDEVDTAHVLPARVALGVAWRRRGRYAVAFDLTAYLPVGYQAVRSARTPSLDVAVDRRAVVNGALGFEYFLTPATPLHAGVFTDLSAAPSPTAAGGEDRVDLVGASLGVGRFSEHTATQVAVVGSLGGAEAVGVDLSSGTYETFVARGTQWRLYAVLSGSYNF